MKTINLIAVVLIFLILISPAQASFATIGKIGMKYGLKFVDPAIGNTVNTVICFANPVLCAQGMVIGEVVGQAYQEIAKSSPEAAQAISVFNQVKEVVDDGMAVVGEIQMDNNGFIETGIFQSKDKSTNIELKNVKLEYDRNLNLNTYTTGKNGGTISFAVKAPGQGSVTVFRNLQEGSVIKTDLNGAIKSADIKLTEQGKFTIGGNRELICQKDSRIVYENDILKVFSENDINYAGRILKPLDKSISLKGDIIEGKFRLNNVDFDGIMGLEADGYLLKSGTLRYNGLILSKNSDKDIFFMNRESIDYSYARANGYNIDFSKYKISDYFYDQGIGSEYADYALMAEDGITFKGNMKVNFQEGNPWIALKKNSIFEIDSTKGEVLLSSGMTGISSFNLPADDSKISLKNGNLNFIFDKKSGKDFMSIIENNKAEIGGTPQTISFSNNIFKIDKNNKLTGSKLIYPLEIEKNFNLRQKLEDLKNLPSNLAGKIEDKIALFFQEEPEESLTAPKQVELQDGTIFYELNSPLADNTKIYGKVYAKEKIESSFGASFYPVREKEGYSLYYMGADNVPLKMQYGISGFKLTDKLLEQTILRSFGEPIEEVYVTYRNERAVVAGTNEPVYPRIIEGKTYWFKK